MISVKVYKSQQWPPVCEGIVKTSGNPKASENDSARRTLSGESLKPHGKMREWTEVQMERLFKMLLMELWMSEE